MLAILLLGLTLAGCEERAVQSQAPLYDDAPVEERTIEVTVEAAGVIEPETTVEVKSKASGEILAVHAETGDVVEANTLLVEVDQRTPRNRLAEAEAALVAARARRTIAETQMKRSETLFESNTLTQADVEQTQLEFANSQAQVVSTEVAVENARIAMDDTDVRAPITGTVIEKTVEPGMVISSPTQAVSDGTILMKMANLDSIRVRTLVDETDIGKIQPGMPSRVTVAAYPNQPFEGSVLKIEPQAIVEQNVTMFAVLIRLDNPGGMLKPGMNAEVEIQVAASEDVVAVPTAALRTNADLTSTAMMLGLTETDLAARLGIGVDGRNGARFLANGNGAARGAGFAGRGADRRAEYRFGGRYWVLAMRDGKPVPTQVETGLTDLAFSEIVSGVEPGDRVLILPSSSLFEQQARLQQFISERFSSTPFQQQQQGRGRRPF